MSERVVETEFVFDRLQAAELSAAYRILVPERPARSARAGQEATIQNLGESEPATYIS